MGVLAKRVKFAGQQLVQVRFRQARVSNHDGVSGDVAQALALRIEPADDAADEVKYRQGVHKSQQVARDDLIELEPQALGVHDAQAKELLADGLSAPQPFASEAVTDTDDEIAPSVEGAPRHAADKLQHG